MLVEAAQSVGLDATEARQVLQSSDYADAVRARSRGEDAGRAMYLAYQIGARIRDTLREAQPDLAAAGCDISDLL